MHNELIVYSLNVCWPENKNSMCPPWNVQTKHIKGFKKTVIVMNQFTNEDHTVMELFEPYERQLRILDAHKRFCP